MIRRALLVTGSRSLALDPAAEAWSRDILVGALEGVTHVINGGAAGPDAWSTAEALRAGVRVTEYRLDGQRWAVSADPADLPFVRPVPTRLGPWTPPQGATGSTPLLRNIALVDALCAARERGWLVSVLAIYDRHSPTHGTGHTVRAAGAAGLEVRRELWG